MIVKSLTVWLGSNTKDFERGMTKAQKRLKKYETEVDRVGKRMTTLGKKMKGVSIAASVVMASSIISFAKFDKAMTESLAIMGNVSSGLREEMEKTAIHLSGRSTFAAKDLAKSYFFLASAGLSAKASIAALPIVTTFAQAGAFDLALATDLLTDAQSALGLTIRNNSIKNMRNMNRVSNVLVKANTLANATTRQFSEALTNDAGPAMRAYGVELEEGVAALAAYADQGIKGNVAGSKFSRMLRLLIKAQAKNTKEFTRLNIAMFNAQGNLNPLADIIGDIERALKGMGTQQRTATLQLLGFEARTQQAILPLIGMSEEMRRYLVELNNAGDISQEVADKQLQALSNKFVMLKNNVVNAAISLGSSFAPAASEVIDPVNEMVKGFTNMPNLMKQSAAGAGVLLTVIAPLALMLGKMSVATAGLSGSFAGFVAGAGSKLGGLGLAVAALAVVSQVVGDAFGTILANDENPGEKGRTKFLLSEIDRIEQLKDDAKKLQADETARKEEAFAEKQKVEGIDDAELDKEIKAEQAANKKLADQRFRIAFQEADQAGKLNMLFRKRLDILNKTAKVEKYSTLKTLTAERELIESQVRATRDKLVEEVRSFAAKEKEREAERRQKEGELLRGDIQGTERGQTGAIRAAMNRIASKGGNADQDRREELINIKKQTRLLGLLVAAMRGDGGGSKTVEIEGS